MAIYSIDSLPFLRNKYTKWYISIIQRALSEKRRKRKRSDPEYQYYESHHIVPRTIGGADHKENLVLLTVKEHCHRY
jgi:hypothetical protein